MPTTATETMTKGEETKRLVLRQAVDLSSELGLEGLTIGGLAKQVGMSKSGLYAHFESKEDLQCEVLAEAAQRFVQAVIVPALKKPRGVPRLRALFERWLRWEGELSGGCLFIAAATELDDRPGPVRDRLLGHMRDMLGTIAKAAEICVEERHFCAGVDVDQLAYEFWAIVVAHHHYGRLLQRKDARKRARKAFDNLIARAS